MLTINNVSFNGKFRYLGATPCSIEIAPLFEIGENNVAKELVEFSKNSKFLNKLKKDRDVFLHYHEEVITQNNSTKNKGFLAKLFSSNKTEKLSPTKIEKDHLSIVFENKKTDNLKETELCEINITLPRDKNSSENFDRFELILENHSDINKLREKADKLFPDNSHKLTLLPYNKNFGWCEFWTGEKSSLDTFNRLQIAIYTQFIDTSKKIIQKLKT